MVRVNPYLFVLSQLRFRLPKLWISFCSSFDLPLSCAFVCRVMFHSLIWFDAERKMSKSRASLLVLFALCLVHPSIATSDLRIHPVRALRGKFILGDANLAPLASTVLLLSPCALSTSSVETSDSNLSLILAEHRTKRPDVLNGFKWYRGGWDFTNKHYWASVGFTGSGCFSVGSLWLISFGFAMVLTFGFKWKIPTLGKTYRRSGWICLWLLCIFTVLAIIGCILLSVGQDSFHKEVSDTLRFVVNQSDFTVQSLRNVSEYLSLAKTVNVAEVSLPLDDLNEIDKINGELSSVAATIDEKTAKNADKVQKARVAVKCTLVVMAMIMLLLSILGLVLSVLRYRVAMFVFVLIGWLLVAATFIICGLFVIADNSITDTCVSMKEWVDNPSAKSALSSILPCVDEKTTNQTLYQSKDVIYQLVNLVNTAINTTANVNMRPHRQRYYNQSGPLMPTLCSPFDSGLADRQCLPTEVSFTNASQVWQNYTCMVSADGLCISSGRVTPDLYQQLVAAVNVTYALAHYTPFLLSLRNCNFVKETFNTITTTYCPPLAHRLKLVISGMVLISVGVMLCLVLWMFYANRPRREEVFVEMPVVKAPANNPVVDDEA